MSSYATTERARNVLLKLGRLSGAMRTKMSIEAMKYAFSNGWNDESACCSSWTSSRTVHLISYESKNECVLFVMQGGILGCGKVYSLA
jgi:hypothetical protein